ncbi:hypothetical protein [Actinoplanes sp. NPDC051851]|uniref:hypothetical protein n=1 Tax=Actinoplanes sp. NPDC051851 TaxID=3154753 RepID=UPI00341A7177
MRIDAKTLGGAAVAAVLVVGAAAAGIGLVTRDSSPSSTVAAAEPVGEPRILRRSPRDARQACRLDQAGAMEWIVRSAPWGRSTGLALRPRNSERCTLSGTPLLSGVDTVTGESAPIPTGAAGAAGALDARVPRQFPATVDPGETARLEVRGTPCAAGEEPRSYRELTVTTGTETIPLPASRTLTGVCGAAVSEWFVEPPMLYAALNATVEAPAVLRRGHDFTYTVTITNVYARDYGWSSCPVYRLGLAATAIGSWRRIVCTREGVDGHDGVAFTLRGRIPSDTEPGEQRLTWIAATSSGEAVIADMATDGTAVTVTG